MRFNSRAFPDPEDMIAVFLSAPKLLVVLALIFFLIGVPAMTALVIYLKRSKESERDGRV